MILREADGVMQPIELVAQAAPLILVNLLYAAIVFVIARKRGIRPWPWTLGTLVPVIGFVVFPVFLLLSFLSMLDRLTALEARDR